MRIGLTTESISLLKKRQAEEDSNRTFCSVESSVKIHSRFAPGFAPDSKPHLSSLNHTRSGRIVSRFNAIIAHGPTPPHTIPESRRKVWTFLADILPDGRIDVAASQRVRGFVVGSHLASSFVEMKLALSLGQESQCAFHGGNLSQRPWPAYRRGTSGGSDSRTGASGAPYR